MDIVVLTEMKLERIFKILLNNIKYFDINFQCTNLEFNYVDDGNDIRYHDDDQGSTARRTLNSII